MDQLLSLEPSPVPEVKKRGYSIWSEGIFAEAFACFPELAFPRLLETLRASRPDDATFILFKSLMMWRDGFAEALSDWLDDPETETRRKALHGLTVCAKQLQIFCGSEAAGTEKRLQRENYPELAQFMRGADVGAPR